MKLLLNARFGIAALALIFVLAGCGKIKKFQDREKEELPPPKTMSANPGSDVQRKVVKVVRPVDRLLATQELKNVHTYYFGEGTTPPPAKLEEMKDLQREYPKLYHALKEGHYIMAWGAHPSDSGGRAVLAYWEAVPVQGGPVLLVNGEVVMMSAEEFKAAPKAGKK
jgi:hypothetical protein